MPSGEPSTRPQHPVTILVADDNADTREVLGEFLNAEGYRTITADNGADTLELMRASLPDAVLLDLMMPILDGWKVLEECARHPDLRHIPVVCISALSGVEEEVRASGAVAFVAKPIDYSHLLLTLRRFATPHSPAREPEPDAAAERTTMSGRIRAAIRESEYLYRTLMEQAWDGVLLFDANLHCLWANARAATLFGYELEQLCRTSYRELVCDEDAALTDTPLCERTCRRRDGTTFVGEVSVKRIDHQARTQVLVRDVTKARQLEEEYRQSQKMEAMGQLAGGIAHDFNNLLTVVIGLSEIVMEQVGPDHAAAPSLRDIHAAGSRAAALTQQLLAFSRKQFLDVRSVNVHAQIEQFARMLRRLIPENIELRVQFRATSTNIDADATLVDQLLLNLSVNAKAAMPDGGVLTLSTENRLPASGDRNRIAITVSDTGVGMNEQTQRRIFEPFFTTKPAGEGTGLGLAMVYGAVQQLGGTIDVRSRVGEGTTFRLEFPCTNAPELESEDGQRPHSDAASVHATLLIVEDEASVRAFVAKALEHKGHRVLAADGPLAGLEIIRQRREPVDLIITDVMMPNMTGPDFVAHVRQIWPGSAVLYMSGYLADPDALGVGTRGVDYLPKPFTIEQLFAKVSALVEQEQLSLPSDVRTVAPPGSLQRRTLAT